MQLQPKLKNKNTVWSANLKPRVGDVVYYNGLYYSNNTGINSAVTDTVNWFAHRFASPPITKSAGNIAASGSDFVINLSADNVPDFPLMSVYVDINGDGGFLPLAPVNYNPVTHILGGMNSGTDFPDQVVKIIVS